MYRLIQQCFTWWNDQTLSVRMFTWLKGRMVGMDENGNRYFTNKNGKRWVIYNGEVEASKIPQGWHGWIHYRTNEIPNFQKFGWEKEHKENLTGTKNAYKPTHNNVQHTSVQHTSVGDDEKQKSKIKQNYRAWQGK